MENKRLLTIIITGITALLIILILGVILILQSKKEEFHPSTVGNTAGNLHNGGYFCEYEGTVYFANSYDGGSLYAMDASETNIRKINSMVVCNLLAGGNSLFYFQKGTSGSGSFENVATSIGFNKSNLKGSKVQSLTRDVIIHAQLVGNQLYLLSNDSKTGLHFYKMKATKSEPVELAKYEISPACAYDGTIYYSGTLEDHHLYALNTANHVATKVYNESTWYPVYYSGYIYFMDPHNNYRLTRLNLSDNEVEVLTDHRVDCFNVGNGFIYYQKNGTEPQLICMRVDGTDPIVIAEGNYTHISMTSQYVYFQEFNDDINLYHSYIGSTTYTSFGAAGETAQKEMLGK